MAILKVNRSLESPTTKLGRNSSNDGSPSLKRGSVIHKSAFSAINRNSRGSMLTPGPVNTSRSTLMRENSDSPLRLSYKSRTSDKSDDSPPLNKSGVMNTSNSIELRKSISGGDSNSQERGPSLFRLSTMGVTTNKIELQRESSTVNLISNSEINELDEDEEHRVQASNQILKIDLGESIELNVKKPEDDHPILQKADELAQKIVDTNQKLFKFSQSSIII